MTHARRTDANQAESVQALRDAGHKVWITSHLGGGVLDLIVRTRKRGISFWLEIKQPGEELTLLEKRFCEWWPHDTHVAWSVEQAVKIAEDIDEEE